MSDSVWSSARALLPLPTLLLLLLFLIVHHHANRKLDEREPPIVSSTIPYIGHVIGMVRSGGRYTKAIASKHSPVFTLPMPGSSRMYIVTDPSLAAAVQKTKTLSFNPIIPQVTKRILGLDPPTVHILSTNIGREDGPDGFYPEVRDLIYSTMTPGDRLDELTGIAARVFQKHLAEYARGIRTSETPSSSLDSCRNTSPSASPGFGSTSSFAREDLLLWTQHIVTIVTAEFLYGPSNPIATDPSLEVAFWDFDHGLGQLLAFASLFPSLTARKAYHGREAVVSALTKYFQSGQYNTQPGASDFIKQRVTIARKYGMSWDGIARSELSFLFAGIVNTAVTSFWLVLRIIADPDLRRAVEGEISATCTNGSLNPSLSPSPSSGSGLRDFDPNLLATACPLFLSTFRETLRLGSDNSSNRLVTTPSTTNTTSSSSTSPSPSSSSSQSSTLLADKYLLAHGSIVQISGAAMHSNKDIWGADANIFDPHRFLPENLKARQVHPAAFRAFGGGTTICPGRHFAAREILYFVAVVLMMFEIEIEGEGEDDGEGDKRKMRRTKIPRKKDDVLPVHVLEPEERVWVKFRVRKEGTMSS